MLSFVTNGNFIDFKYTEDQYPNYVHLITKLHNTSKCITWCYGDDTSLISFTIDDMAYDNVPISSIYFDGVVMSAQADFKTNIEAMFPGLGGGGSSYLVYTAYTEQLGSSSPNLYPKQDDFGDVSATRQQLGWYKITSPSFPSDSRFFVSGVGDWGGDSTISIPMYQDGVGVVGYILIVKAINEIHIYSYNTTGSLVELNSLLGGGYFYLPDIRVYP